MKLKEEKRIHLADKIIDLANLIFAGWLLGQAFIDKPFNLLLALGGGVLFFGLWLLALWLIK